MRQRPQFAKQQVLQANIPVPNAALRTDDEEELEALPTYVSLPVFICPVCFGPGRRTVVHRQLSK